MKIKHQGTVKGLGVTAREFARRLRQEFSKDIASNPREFKKQVVRFIQRELPPGPGRPHDPRYDEAAKMTDQGKTVPEILRLLDPGFDSLDSWTRMLAARGLRAALRRRGCRIHGSVNQRSEQNA